MERHRSALRQGCRSPLAKHELSPGAEALFLEAGIGNQRHEFLIAPETGEEIKGAAYQNRERHRVGLLDDGYVETAVDHDKGTVEYWHMSFGGEELANLETHQRPAEGDIDPGSACRGGGASAGLPDRSGPGPWIDEHRVRTLGRLGRPSGSER